MDPSIGKPSTRIHFDLWPVPAHVGAVSTDAQTSIMAVQFEGGVVIGADTRTTSGSYIVNILLVHASVTLVVWSQAGAKIDVQANRVTDKLTHIHDRIYCCRSGSAADTQAVADIVHQHAQLYTAIYGGPPPVGELSS